MSVVKEEAIRLIQSLPDDCSLEEIQYHRHRDRSCKSGSVEGLHPDELPDQ